ncbi:MAG: pyridoxal-dependent decarboxylase [Acidimicrobiaceae bacterium]|nr:pyridoxal-dependent decarboxylase [Acidimicrobiaceae bacterium]
MRAMLGDAAPETAEPFAALLRDLDEVVVPGLAQWQHPGWFTYFPAQSSPPSILGEMASAALGAQGMMWVTSPAVTEIESHVLDWFVDLTGAPQDWKTTGPGGGVIQMSASDSTHTALVVAREECRGRTGATAEHMVAYTSAQAHSSIEKGARVAGIGHVRLVEVDDCFAARPEVLARTITDDLASGLAPMFVGASVGTTATTAVDPIRAIGEIAAQHNLWFHVDAAYAGAAMICEEFRHHQDGLELVDSYTFNPHKWLATNFDCSVFWVADRKPLIDTLAITPPYLANAASDAGEVIDYRDWHVPLGRRFRALKLWWVLRSFGVEGLRERIRANVRQARGLAEWIEQQPELTVIAPTPFALVCFAHVDGDDATQRLLAVLNSDADVYVLGSSINQQAFIRVSIGSTWTTDRHVAVLQERIESALATPQAGA